MAQPPPWSGQLEQMLALYRMEGFTVVGWTDHEVALERKNPLIAHLLELLLAPLSHVPPTPRVQRLWLDVGEDGEARARLHAR